MCKRNRWGVTQYIGLYLVSLLFITKVSAQVNPAPDRDRGEGPFKRLIIRGATVVDGSGAPPVGPVDIVIEGNKIKRVQVVGTPQVPIKQDERPSGASKEIDASGAFVLPGFINLHAHVGGEPKAPQAEYAYKLWMAHGITTIRGVPAGDVNWSLSEKQRSAANRITAPRIVAYQVPGQGEDWKQGAITTPAQARAWVRWAKSKGVDGIKIFNFPPDIVAALLDEAGKHKMGSVAHLSQMMVAGVNAAEAARLGLTGMTHFYGLFEAMYEQEDIQHWPTDLNYGDEQARFSQVARQWDKVVPGGKKWQAVMQTFLEHDFFIDPTMTAYLAGRDVMRERNAEWHRKYTLPSLWDFYMPSRTNHGS